MFLNTLLDTIGPGAVATGGTNIGDALMTVLEKMLDGGNSGNPEAVDIVLITDGEDLGEDPAEAIELLNQLGTRLLIIGLGDTRFGARVPTRDGTGWAMDDGREHWSRLDDVRLRALSQQADKGIYFPVGTAWLDLPEILDQLRILWPVDSREQGEVMEYTEGYPYLMALAMLMLGLSLVQFPGVTKAATVLPCLLLLFASISQADATLDRHAQEQRAINLTEQGLHSDAANIFRQIADTAEDQQTAVAASYNLATSLIHLANDRYEVFMDAVDFIDEAAESDEYIDPEIYLSEARKVLRDILQTDPGHEPSKRNLEWLALEQFRLHQDSDSAPVQQQQQGEQQEEEDAEANSENDEEGDDGLEQEGDESADSDTNESDSVEFDDDMNMMFGDLLEPTPSASAKQILDSGPVT